MAAGSESSSTQTMRVPLGELVMLFEEEAQRMCYTDGEARILAAEALSDFLTTYSRHFVVG